MPKSKSSWAIAVAVVTFFALLGAAAFRSTTSVLFQPFEKEFDWSRADTSLEGLAKLRPVFAAKGSVTAGNSSQTSDGAGALILASESAVKRFGLTPLARFVGGRCDGCHMQLSAMAVDRLNHTGPDEIASCEECGRLLIR